MKKVFYILLTSTLLLVQTFVFHPIQAGETGEKFKRVIVVHSYHKGQTWNDALSDGIASILELDNIELNFEYLDTIHFPDDGHLDDMADLLEQKYGRGEKHVDVVVTTDEEALSFTLMNRDQLFQDAAIVYCGINYYTDRFWEPKLTGIIESVDLSSNVRLAKQINPSLRQVYVIMDHTPTSISLINNFIPVLEEFSSEINFQFSEYQAFDSLLSEIRQLSNDTAVFLINYTNAKTGRVMSMAESARRIVESSPVPVYSVWDCYMNQGTLGGKMISGHDHGRSAGEIALRILSGESADSIPVQTSVPTKYIFDYNLLQKFSINENTLPEEKIILNQPDTLYQRFKRLFALFLVGILALSSVIVTLSLNIARRRRVELSLKRYSDRLNFLHRLDQSILDNFSLKTLGEQILRPTIQRIKCDMIGIYLFEQKTSPAWSLALKQSDFDAPLENFVFAMDTLPKELMVEKNAVTLRGGSFPSQKMNTFHTEFSSFSSYMLLPLVHKKEMLGIFFLAQEKNGEFELHQKIVCQQIAHTLALAIQNHYLFLEITKHEASLRHMSINIIEAQEQERKRISAELHDEFGQSLTAIGLNFSVIRKKMGNSLASKVESRMIEIEKAIELLSDQVHNLSLDLRPPMLDDLGLVPTFRWFLNQYQERSGTIIKLSVEEIQEKAIPNQVSVTMYRVLQEALNNVFKHAEASKIEVSLILSNHSIMLKVCDNGKGFNVEDYRFTEPGKGGLGLLGMQERLELLNGYINVHSKKDSGTTIRAVAPLRRIRCEKDQSIVGR